MRYVLNSAVVTDFGSYSYEPMTVDSARAWISRAPVVSQVGYQNTADWIADRLGVRLPLSREARRIS